MRAICVGAAFVVLAATPCFAQEWVQYVSKADLFGVNFPREPKIQEISYTTEFGIALPGRAYSADDGASHYLVTVVDYRDAEKLHTARVEECKKKGGEGDACQNDWRSDVQGSIVFATAQFLKRDAKVTHFGWAVVDQVEGHRLQLTNADQSRTFAEIHRHGTRLYILEATVPPRLPAPGLFQQSLMFTDEEGKPIRYRRFYTTGYSDEWKFPAPPPPRPGAPPQ
jgi:hypothetical protein